MEEEIFAGHTTNANLIIRIHGDTGKDCSPHIKDVILLFKIPLLSVHSEVQEAVTKSYLYKHIHSSVAHKS